MSGRSGVLTPNSIYVDVNVNEDTSVHAKSWIYFICIMHENCWNAIDKQGTNVPGTERGDF